MGDDLDRMYPNASHERLQADAVLTATPEQLLVLLFDAAVRFARQAERALRADQVTVASTKIGRVEAILDELLATLDHEAGGELAERLQALYVWCRRCLVEARVERSAEKVGHVLGILDELRDAFTRAAAAAPAAAAASAVPA